MNKRPAYSPEVHERAVRMVLTSEHDHSSRWAAIKSIASKIGCTPETLRTWVNKIEVDSGAKAAVTSDHAAQLKALERENRELKRTNEILHRRRLFSPRRSATGRHPAQTEVMVDFVDHHRDLYGVEPICQLLPVAPSTFHRCKALEREPDRRSAHSKRDE